MCNIQVRAKTTQKYSSKQELNNYSMMKYRSLVELKLNPNVQTLSLTLDPTLLLPKK